MSDTGAAPLAKARSMSENKIVRIVSFTIGIILTIIVTVFVILELFAYLAFCGFYGQYDRFPDLKKSVIPGEVFFTTACVVIVGALSLVATLFCAIISVVNRGPSTVRTILLISALAAQFFALGIVIIQSANYGGHARVLQDAFLDFCKLDRDEKYKKNCLGMLNSLWAVFAGCLMLVFSIFVNLIYTIMVMAIKS